MGYRGPKKHLKRLAAPKTWMLDKLGGAFTVRPSAGPHKLSESLPIALFLRNRLKYAKNVHEVKSILKQRLVKIDGKVRTDHKFPCGFMDVIQLEKSNENFRLIYDVKGRFCVHRITPTEAKYRLSKVKSVFTGPKGIPYLTTTDGRTFRYPDPNVKTNDSIQVTLDAKGAKIQDVIKFENGNLCMVTGGRNTGRVGTIISRERHPGSFDIIHIKDSSGATFATRMGYVFVIGKASKPYISLPRAKGIKVSVAEERDRRLGAVKKEK